MKATESPVLQCLLCSSGPPSKRLAYPNNKVIRKLRPRINRAKGHNLSRNSGRRMSRGSPTRHRGRHFRRSPSRSPRSHGINQAQTVRNRPTCGIRMASIRKTSTKTGPDCPSINNTGGRTATIVMDGTMNIRDITRTTDVTTTTIGRNTAHATGGQITVHGNSEEVIADTTFLNTALVDTLALVISSGFTIYRFWFSGDIRAFSTVATGSASLTHGQNTGLTTGMRRTMCTSSTAVTATTCATAGIPA